MSLPGSRSGRAAPSIADTAALVERITLEADLRNALVAGDLVLRYQPIVDLGTARIMAFEALCRWRHWSKGLVEPAHFMPLAEETGLIVPIGGWVLEQACRRLAQWRARIDEAPPIDVTVNLSAVELRDRGLVDRAAHALDASGLPAQHLVVEVSEAAAYAEPHGPAVSNLSALVELGVGVAIDDIGVSGRPDPDGWLWTLPIRLLKIERGVATRVSGGPAGGRAGRVLTATLQLAAERGVPVVAKGIETPEQQAGFADLGCHAGQGFLFARPMDPADAEAYLRRAARPPR